MARLNFKKLGEGEPIIIIHGLYGSSDNWVSIARELMSNFLVYIIDLRNHGASEHLPEHNYKVMTEDVVEFMNSNNIISANIIGHSMGGKVAMFLAAYYPNLLKKLIVVDISPKSYNINGGKHINNHKEILEALSLLDIAQIESRGQVDDLLSNKISSRKVRQFLLKNLKRGKDKSFYWKINVDSLKDNLSNILVGLEREKNRLLNSAIQVLFVKGGESDYITSVDELMIEEYFKRVKIVTIKDASHWVHAEKPDEFIEIVRTFIVQ